MWLSADRRTGRGRNPAHVWRQAKHARHAARRRRKSTAGQHLHEPVSEALAFDWPRRHVPRSRPLLNDDDFVILSRSRAAEALAWTKAVMTKLGLTINEAKTSLRSARQERFDFLGYSFGAHWFEANGKWYLGASPSKKSLQRFKTRVGDLLVPSNIDSWPEVRTTLNRSLRGWSNYFGYGSRGKAYRSVDQYVFERVRRFLARRHKVQGRGNRRFTFDVIHRELGVVCLQRLPRASRRVPCGEASRKAGCRNRLVRLYERGWETGRWRHRPQATAPILESTTTDVGATTRIFKVRMLQ